MKWDTAIRDYAHYLKIERGLSENSIDNYRLDVRKLVNFLQNKDIDVHPNKITSEYIQLDTKYQDRK